MLINKSNAEIINSTDVYVHDDVLLKFEFDHNIKKLVLHLEKQFDFFRKYNIVFTNVLGIEMSACDFWGSSDAILDFEYLHSNAQIIIPKLQNELDKLTDNQLGDLCNYFIEVKLTFKSGDTLGVVCESIQM